VPRAGTRSIRKADDRTVVIEIAQGQGWQVAGKITCTFLPQCTIRADYEMEFDADYKDFNTLVSAYFHEATLPYLRIAGEWQQVALPDQMQHRFWCRSQQDLGDFRKALDAMNADYAGSGFPDLISVDDLTWEEPVMVNTTRNTGWAVAMWFDKNVRSVSANVRWQAHDFSIGGFDVKKGESIMSTLYMAYRKIGNMDDLLKAPAAR